MSCDIRRDDLQTASIRTRQFMNSFVITVAMTVGMIGLCGCDYAPPRDAPPTHPVSGKVLWPDGTPPVGATVEFQPKTNQFEMTAMGAVKADGAFTLSIPFTDRKIVGATEGPHHVTVRMPLGSGRASGSEFVLPETFVVRPSENSFTITLPRSK